MVKYETKHFIKAHPETLGMKWAVKKACYAMAAMLYKSYIKISKPVVTKKRFNVSICAIFRNEAPYLKEWLEFHHLVGVEHFYLYNNNSEDDYESVLKPYIEKGWVTLIEWPHKQKQIESYRDCIEKYAQETKWIGFIDLDEFVIPKTTDNIYDFLKDFEAYGSVLIYWKVYGTSGYVQRDMNGLILENFVVCWSKYCDIGKCFYNTAYGFDGSFKNNAGLMHLFWANRNGKNIPPVNVFGHVCVGNYHRADCKSFPIQINHYFTKSYQEYDEVKRARGYAYGGEVHMIGSTSMHVR